MLFYCFNFQFFITSELEHLSIYLKGIVFSSYELRIRIVSHFFPIGFSILHVDLQELLVLWWCRR